MICFFIVPYDIFNIMGLMGWDGNLCYQKDYFFSPINIVFKVIHRVL